MADMRSKVQEIYALEQMAAKDTVIHRLHPGAKLITTFVFILTVVSFDRFQFRQLIPFLFYPAILMSLAELPWSLALKRVALALPFVLLAGISNIIFDRAPVFMVGNITVSSGFLSFASIILRTFLTVIALILLIGTTPFSQLTAQLRRAHIPEMLITLFEMTYRYIGVLLEETATMTTAYHLRHRRAKGLEMKHMGSFAGSLLLRSFDRAGRIYSAMKCRGYGRQLAKPPAQAWRRADIVYTLLFCVFCLGFRIVDMPLLMGNLFGRFFA